MSKKMTLGEVLNSVAEGINTGVIVIIMATKQEKTNILSSI
jgi:hypothetical protein